jgi:hypothetical protein
MFPSTCGSSDKPPTSYYLSQACSQQPQIRTTVGSSAFQQVVGYVATVVASRYHSSNKNGSHENGPHQMIISQKSFGQQAALRACRPALAITATEDMK